MNKSVCKTLVEVTHQLAVFVEAVIMVGDEDYKYIIP